MLIKVLTGLLLAGAGLYLLVLRPWRLERLLDGRVPSVDGLFLLALVMGLASLHSGPPFEQVSLRLVEYTELPETLMEVDLQIQAIERWPQEVWADLMARLGWDEPEPQLAPEPPQPGWVTETVLPSVLTVVETLLRGFVYWGSLVLIAVCLAVRLAIGLVRGIRKRSRGTNEAELEAEVSRLQEKIATLETKLVD